MVRSGMLRVEDLPLVEERLADINRYREVNTHFTKARGHKWVNRLQSFIKWLWENQETILKILGIVIMFADDGTPYARKEEDVAAEKKKKPRKKKKPAPKTTPDGEEVIDFTITPSKTVKGVFLKSDAMPEDESGWYDIGLSGAENDEVQPGETSSEATDRLKSDDL